MDLLKEADFKKIIARRDRRYDGQFYFGVKTTRIYCRPVCPARPKPENILIFKSPSEAERAGYRPCLRCHPDVAPGSRFLEGTANTVVRAMHKIEQQVEWDLNVESLAESLGLTSRHLRRLFDQHLGAAPIEIMVTKRLHLARQLLTETHRPITEIAFAVGFQSVRRFNEAFRKLYRKSPSQMRADLKSTPSDALVLRLPIRQPYDWKTVLEYLARHEAYGIEQIENETYKRFVPRGNKYATLSVSLAQSNDHLMVRLENFDLSEVRSTLARLKLLFDTEHNPEHLPRKKLGVRVPGAFDTFEIAVSIILSQLISTVQAKQKLKALIQRFGKELAPDVFAFPTPRILKTARLEELGLTSIRAQALRELASQVEDGRLSLSPASDHESTIKQLLSIRGIGPWTAAMIAMRCLGDADAFPEQDLIVKRALESGSVDPNLWSSSRAYLTHTLWNQTKRDPK